MREYLKFEDIDEEIRLINIEGVNYDYVSPSGNVYKYMRSKDKYLKKKLHTNANNGYVYCGINCLDGNKSRRVHRLVALTYIDNPNRYDTVGHKNNIKNDNRLENLYWTTVSKNTQKAVDDGLLVNDIGAHDSQSIHVACYNNSHELISVYGSISEAGRCIDGTSKSSIAKVVDKTNKGRKGFYYKSITKDEFIQNTDKKNLKFKMPSIQKKRRKFKATSPTNEVYYSDNQKQFALAHNLSQAMVSHRVRDGSLIPYNGWVFEEIK